MEWIESIDFLGIKLINIDDFAELIIRFIFNMGVLLAIVRFPYLRHSRHCGYTFSFLAVGATVFLLCFLLNNVKLSLGFALGLFAIFGIIRYRTDTMPFKQMTYLFVVIGISVINALANKKVSYSELVFTNLAIFAGLWLLENYLDHTREGSMKIVYDNISNVNVGQYEVLLEDLKVRTGFDIHHFDIEKIDYLKDVATIMIYFKIDDNSYSVDENLKLKQ